jgi:DNA (cytosine-5)-methyltransferase 1
MGGVYYNDNDPRCCSWLSNLIAAGKLPPGHVDSRSIKDIKLNDPIPPTAHFFAGIGGWPPALALANWPPSIPVWTGSCPCQPYSAAGKRKGDADERNLWPQFLRLIRHHKPPVCFGEQVASKDGRDWLAGVRVDLEKLGYEVGAADLCAAGIGEKVWVEIIDEVTGEVVYEDWEIAGPPHIRQRLYWVAFDPSKGISGMVRSQCPRRESRGIASQSTESYGTQGTGPSIEPGRSSDSSRLVHAPRRQTGLPGCPRLARGATYAYDLLPLIGGLALSRPTLRERGQKEQRSIESCEAKWNQEATHDQRSGTISGMVRSHGSSPDGRLAPSRQQSFRDIHNAGGKSFWYDFDILPCLDGKSRRVEPGTSPLATGVPSRMVKLRGYGNSIVPPLAAEFISAFLECL